jgi:hypothetical protein
MKCFKITLFAVMFALAGCSRDNRIITYSSFPVEETVHLEQVELPDTVLMQLPYRMAKSDSLVFILDLAAVEGYFILCYSYPDFKYLYSFCKKGQGPEEYVSIMNINLIDNILYFGIGGLGHTEIHYLDIKTFTPKNPVIDKIKFSNDYGQLPVKVKCGNNFYMPNLAGLNNKRVLEFDGEGNFVSSFGEIRADVDSRMGGGVNKTLFEWIPVANGNADILVLATQFGEVIDLFFLKENHRQLTLKGKGGVPNEPYHPSSAGIEGFNCVAVTKTHIYAVYNGEKISESHEYRHGGQYIYVFDYKGNPVKKITLDKFIWCMYIDEAESALYALSTNEDQPLFKVKLALN